MIAASRASNAYMRLVSLTEGTMLIVMIGLRHRPRRTLDLLS